MARRRKPELVDLLAEAERRKAALVSAPKFLDLAFDAQRAFIEDPTRLKCALCTARAGKSSAAGLYLLKEAYERPGTANVYATLTRDSARRILWGPILKDFDRRLGLGCTFNETTLEVRLPNGSTISLLGLDSDPQDADKLLGQKFRLVVLDEAASFRQDLDHVVYTILRPRMSDLDGSICLIGTPGNIKRGLFWRITSGQPSETDARWSVHRWGQLDNPHMREKFLAELAEIDRDRPLFKETPQFKHHYQGLWVTDDSKLVYHYDPARNLYSQIPPANYRLTLGVDLGHSPDPSAFVLTGYAEHDPALYVIEAWSKTKMDITDVANVIHDFQKRYDIDTVVIDGANKQAVAELANRHGLALISADKRGKADFQAMLDAEIIQGKVKIHDSCTGLIDEIDNLVWDDMALRRSGKRQESSACANHELDGLLYAWRHTYSYLATPGPGLPPAPGTSEWVRKQQEEWELEAEARHRPRSDWDFPTDL